MNTDELKKHCRADFNALPRAGMGKHLKRMKEVKAIKKYEAAI